MATLAHASDLGFRKRRFQNIAFHFKKATAAHQRPSTMLKHIPIKNMSRTANSLLNPPHSSLLSGKVSFCELGSDGKGNKAKNPAKHNHVSHVLVVVQ
jgi:hypothetical protein